MKLKITKIHLYVGGLFIMAILAWLIVASITNNDNSNTLDLTEGIADESNFSTGGNNNFVVGERPGQQAETPWGTYVVIAILAIVVGPGTVFFFYVFVPLGLWWEARLSGVRVSWWKLIKMRWQKVPHDLILKLMIRAYNAHIKIKPDDLTEQYLAHVDLQKVVEMIILGNSAGLDLSVAQLGYLYHAEVDVEKVVKNQVKAKNAGIAIPLKDLADSYLAKVDIEKAVDANILAFNAGVPVEFSFLSRQYLAGVDPGILVNAMRIANEGRLNVDKMKLVNHALEGGRILAVVKAVVSANNADMELDDEDKLLLNFDIAANIDLAGIDIAQAVSDAINFKVIETDDIVGYTGDGVQIIMKARITIRPKIRRIIKGAGEDTVRARVNEGLASEIGRVENHYQILEDPYLVADYVEQKKELFKDTAFDVRSIDILDIRVGKSIQAEIDIERAKAKSENARAAALSAEEEVQKAMADAFRQGTFSIEDYKRMKNIESDTRMRDSLGNPKHEDYQQTKKKRRKKDEDDEE